MSACYTDSAYLYLHDSYTPGKKRKNPTIEISTTVHSRMARATLTLKSCIQPCQNGSGHSGTQIMQLAEPEWLEPLLHSSHATDATGLVRMARAILALKSCNLHGCARMARAILALKLGQCMALLACKNGLSHSGTANHI